mgnify:CR=1 FL=1
MRRVKQKGQARIRAAHAVSQVTFFALLIYFFAFSGPLRAALGQSTRVVTIIITVTGFLLTSCALLKLRRKRYVKAILILLAANLAWMTFSSILGDSPLWGVVAGALILLFLPNSLILGLAYQQESEDPLVLRLSWLLVAANLLALTLQIIFLSGLDRGSGLLGNERASNTIALFTMLTSLGLWLRDKRFASPALLSFGLASVLGWLGDSKAAIGLVLILVVIFGATLTARTFGKLKSQDQLRKLIVAALITAFALLLAWQGVATGSSANIRSEVREGLSELYVNSSDVGDSDSHGLLVAVAGQGLGTGGSLLGLLAAQGAFSMLPDSEVLAEKHLDKLEERRFQTSSTGLLYSPNKTLVGLLDEVGIIGMLLYAAIVITVLLQFRDRVDGAALLAVFFMLSVTAALTPFVEYPEVALSVSLFLILQRRQANQSKTSARSDDM